MTCTPPLQVLVPSSRATSLGGCDYWHSSGTSLLRAEFKYQRCTVLYYTILYYTILYYTILYYTILYYTILYYTILYCTVLYYTILYYTILYSTLLYSTLLYSTLLYYTKLYYTLYTIHYTLYTILYYTTLPRNVQSTWSCQPEHLPKRMLTRVSPGRRGKRSP